MNRRIAKNNWQTEKKIEGTEGENKTQRTLGEHICGVESVKGSGCSGALFKGRPCGSVVAPTFRIQEK